MTESSNAVPFDAFEGDWEQSSSLDSTCPECGNQSIITYLDRYSNFEYCNNCEWSDEDESVPTREQIAKPERRYIEE